MERLYVGRVEGEDKEARAYVRAWPAGVGVPAMRPDEQPGEPLDPRFDLVRHSPDGFEWGYGGSGPAQLALAILVDHFKHAPADVEILRGAGVDIGAIFPSEDRLTDGERCAVKLYQQFKFRVVGRFGQGESWTLTTFQVREVVRELAYERRGRGGGMRREPSLTGPGDMPEPRR